MKLLLRRISEANFATMDPTRKANLRDRKGIRYFLKRNKESSQEESSNKETQRRMKRKSSRFCEEYKSFELALLYEQDGGGRELSK
ncbi:hypothetical protein TNCV_4622641 [Trichonephila clavipes]|nr:hypothetical protein TNCV_4622641 [Trichonephila clavipes]